MDSQNDIKLWIEENIIRSADAYLYTGQSRDGFKQSFLRGHIRPYISLNKQGTHKRPTHLFLKKDLVEYKNKKKL